MFRRIAVAYNETPESRRALDTAIQLAKTLDAELEMITVMSALPSYTVFASAADPELTDVLRNDRLKFYETLHHDARTLALAQGLRLNTTVVGGSAVVEIVALLHEHKADLLVIGLHQSDSHIARLWSTVYGLAQGAPCSVLGVH